jgi:hypothetical protein
MFNIQANITNNRRKCEVLMSTWTRMQAQCPTTAPDLLQHVAGRLQDLLQKLQLLPGKQRTLHGMWPALSGLSPGRTTHMMKYDQVTYLLFADLLSITKNYCLNFRIHQILY